jgi:hypothetical protein
MSKDLVVSDFLYTFALSFRNRVTITRISIKSNTLYNMKKLHINRIYLAYAVAIICFGSCIPSENPYLNAFVILLGFVICVLILAYAFDNPTENEEKVINKFSNFL